MPIVQRSHRVLYADTSEASRRAEQLLNRLKIEFARVLVENPLADPRGLYEFPAFTYVTRSGVQVTKQGLARIEAILDAIQSDYASELREAKAQGEKEADWDPEQLAETKYLLDLTR